VSLRIADDLVLILCSPRSCSSVVCAMLGQHPQLYGFPELNLFVADTLGELWRLGNSPIPGGPSYLTGLLRAIAELEFGGQTDETIRRGRDLICSRCHWTTKQMLDRLLTWIHPKIGVDKSPRTGLSQRSIDRALSACPRSRIIHLTRHPVSTLRSLNRNHRHTVTMLGSSSDPVWLANFYAHLWVRSQELILSTVHKIGPAMSHKVRAEDLLLQPDHHLTHLTKWLGIRWDPEAIEAMKHPENSPFSRPAAMGLDGDGDPGFLLSPHLRPRIDYNSQLVPPEWKLSQAHVEKVDNLSRLLGYGPII